MSHSKILSRLNPGGWMRNGLSLLKLSVLIPGLVLAALLAWVGVSVALAASSGSPAMASAPVTIVDNAFQSPSVTVNVGDTVVWTNTGSRAHTSTSGTSPAPDNRWNSGSLNTGQSFSFTFAAPGVYAYFCQIHPSMTGSITVGGAAASTPSPSPSATAMVTPTGAVGSAAVSLTASPTLSTSTTPASSSTVSLLTSTPTGTPTPSIPAPTNLQVISSGPQPGTYTLTWVAPAGVTIQEYRVQSIQASGTPVPITRAPGSQNGVAMRVDPAMGYAVAVYAVDTSNRLSGPSNVVNTAGAPTATPIPTVSVPAGQAPYGYGGAPVPGSTGTQPYSGANPAQPYSGTNPAQPYSGANSAQPYSGTYSAPPYGSGYPQTPYGGAYPQVPYGGAYGPQRPPVYGPAGGICPGMVLIGGQCQPR